MTTNTIDNKFVQQSQVEKNVDGMNYAMKLRYNTFRKKISSYTVDELKDELNSSIIHDGFLPDLGFNMNVLSLVYDKEPVPQNLTSAIESLSIDNLTVRPEDRYITSKRIDSIKKNVLKKTNTPVENHYN